MSHRPALYRQLTALLCHLYEEQEKLHTGQEQADRFFSSDIGDLVATKLLR